MCVCVDVNSNTESLLARDLLMLLAQYSTSDSLGMVSVSKSTNRLCAGIMVSAPRWS